jgi:hypothetical protein
LGKVHECAARNEGNRRPQSDQNGSEQQQHGYPFALEQAPTKSQIRPGERCNQGTSKTRDDKEHIEQHERTNDTLEHNGKRVAKNFAWLR